MLKKVIISLLTTAFFAASLSASQKIVTFESSFDNKDEKILEIKKLGGNPLKDLWLINAMSAVFPDDVKDSKIYSLKGVIRVEEDIYQNWLQSEEIAFNANPLPSVKKIIGGINENPADFSLPLPETAEEKKGDDAEIPWGIERVNAPLAWAQNQGEGIKVAVVDTGVDYTHPDLSLNYKGGYNAIDPEASPLDDNGHGTHVSGTIGAIRDGKGVAGVAPKASLYGVKVLSASGSGSYSDIIDGIQWCVKNEIQVINMSLGGRYSIASFHEAIQKAKEAGITIVCAAGNDGGAVNYPAKYEETIAVSASNSSDNVAYFSSRGAEIDFIAPGVSVYSTYKDGKYATLSGTSMASPHVAGLAVLSAAIGNSSPDAVKASLTGAATDIGLEPDIQGEGLIDADKIK